MGGGLISTPHHMKEGNEQAFDLSLCDGFRRSTNDEHAWRQTYHTGSLASLFRVSSPISPTHHPIPEIGRRRRRNRERTSESAAGWPGKWPNLGPLQ